MARILAAVLVLLVGFLTTVYAAQSLRLHADSLGKRSAATLALSVEVRP
jgi:hypothetical protein